VPTATIVTEAFLEAARRQARNLGIPGLPLAIVEHPFAGQARETVEARAEQAAPQVVTILTEPAELLADRFARADPAA